MQALAELDTWNTDTFDVGLLVSGSRVLCAATKLFEKTYTTDVNGGNGTMTVRDTVFRCGRICGHNVAIGICTGESSVRTASAFSAMRTAFPKIKYIASLGVTRGRANNTSLQLGDVVTSGEKGVAIASLVRGRDPITTSLQPPGSSWLAAVNKVNEDKNASIESVAVQLRAKFDSDLRTEWELPPCTEYKHSAGERATKADSRRTPRAFSSVIPVLADYGTNHAAVDKMCESLLALCVDKEASGVAATSPVQYLIIRGIKEYTSDERTCGDWESYAAMSAVSYLMLLMNHLPARTVCDSI